MVAYKVINENYTTSIPGKYILDGVFVSHEVLHELRCMKKQGIILKFDFEKA